MYFITLNRYLNLNSLYKKQNSFRIKFYSTIIEFSTRKVNTIFGRENITLFLFFNKYLHPVIFSIFIHSLSYSYFIIIFIQYIISVSFGLHPSFHNKFWSIMPFCYIFTCWLIFYIFIFYLIESSPKVFTIMRELFIFSHISSFFYSYFI